MRGYLINLWLMVAMGVFFGRSGALYPALLLFVLPTAFYWALGAKRLAAGIVFGAVLSALFAGGGVGGMAEAFTVSGTGVVMGEATRRRWGPGTCIAAATLYHYALVAIRLAWDWREVRHQYTIWLNARTASLQEAIASGNEMARQTAELWKALDTQLAYVYFGMVFVAILLAAALGMALLGRWLRAAYPGAAPRGRFAFMRVPDALVWLAILVALCWFADQRWPSDVLRLFTWNSAIGLAGVYWLSGVAIFSYGLAAFQLNLLAAGAMVVLFALLHWLGGLFPLVSAVGLFDTWFDFRARIERAAALRRQRQGL